MSRTYKDKPYKHCEHWKSWQQDRTTLEGTWRTIQLPTTKPKRKKELDTEDHWMTTPSWWNRMQHTRPERRSAKVALSQVSDVEEADIPDLGRKPNIYFW